MIQKPVKLSVNLRSTVSQSAVKLSVKPRSTIGRLTGRSETFDQPWPLPSLLLMVVSFVNCNCVLHSVCTMISLFFAVSVLAFLVYDFYVICCYRYLLYDRYCFVNVKLWFFYCIFLFVWIRPVYFLWISWSLCVFCTIRYDLLGCL